MSTLASHRFGFGAFAKDIKLSHSIFALPFALAAAWLVTRTTQVHWSAWLWIVLAMVGARSSAMGFNRIVDRHIDAANARTGGRQLASGAMSLAQAWLWVGLSTAIFAICAYLLSPLCLYLSPLVLAVLWGYSLTKRFTALCHLVLGFALGLAPICVWIALTGQVSTTPMLMAAAITTWVGGFDILYSLQDRGFDKDRGLHSIPVALGEVGALVVSALLHIATLSMLAAIPLSIDGLGWPYWLGWLAIAGLLAWEHWAVRPGDLSRMNAAFFSANGYVSIIFLGSVVTATLL